MTVRCGVAVGDTRDFLNNMMFMTDLDDAESGVYLSGCDTRRDGYAIGL